MTKVRLAVAAGVVMLALSGFAQAGPTDGAAAQEEESILRVEILLHDPHSKPRGDRDIAVYANGDFTVFRFRVFRTYGDGTGGVRQAEYAAVRAACEASRLACIALTRRIVVDVGYR